MVMYMWAGLCVVLSAQGAPVKKIRKPPQVVAPVKKTTPVLDVSVAPPKEVSSEGALDFGISGEMDFGGEEGWEMPWVGGVSGGLERQRFDAALARMTDEDYMGAALEWRALLDTPGFEAYKQDVEYQLAKALAQWGFYEASLQKFKVILAQGPVHKRFKKAVEWLFFLSRNMVDEEAVLSELARFKSVSFGGAYKDEYKYWMGKYWLMQAQALEVKSMQEASVSQGKASQEAALDFGSETQENAFNDNTGLDFGVSEETETHTRVLPTSVVGLAKEAQTVLLDVAPGSVYGIKAAYLRGVLHVLMGEDKAAVEVFQGVVRSTRDASDPSWVDVRERAFMALARIHYGAEQFDRSVYYYDRIDRDSEHWLTALFESSWAYFRRGDPAKALGQLTTLHAPFFEREYFPESHIVRAVIYYEGCRYAKARETVEQFIGSYTEVLKEMDRLSTAQASAQDLYEQLLQASHNAQKSQSDALSKVLQWVLSDGSVKTLRSVVRALEAQLSALQASGEGVRQSVLGQEIETLLHAHIAQKTQMLTEAVKYKIRTEHAQLKGLMSQALRVKLEVARAEREMAEMSLQPEAKKQRWLTPSSDTDVDDDHLYWPYEGEYWRDELGYYQVDFGRCVPLPQENR
jgi:tetratricopeptide (TPR) repeat protein